MGLGCTRRPGAVAHAREHRALRDGLQRRMIRFQGRGGSVRWHRIPLTQQHNRRSGFGIDISVPTESWDTLANVFSELFEPGELHADAQSLIATASTECAVGAAVAAAAVLALSASPRSDGVSDPRLRVKAQQVESCRVAATMIARPGSESFAAGRELTDAAGVAESGGRERRHGAGDIPVITSAAGPMSTNADLVMVAPLGVPWIHCAPTLLTHTTRQPGRGFGLPCLSMGC